MSTYDVLMENLPDYFKPVLEYIQIMGAHGYALDQLDSNIRSVYDNFYIQTCDVATLSYYEGLLGILPGVNDTIDFRRQRVMQQLSLVPRFDINWLNDKLTELYGPNGYDLTVSSVDSTLDINITSGTYAALQLFYDFIWDVLPAHMELSSRQNVTTDIPVGINIGMVASSTVTTIINSPTVYSTDIPVGINMGMVASSTVTTIINSPTVYSTDIPVGINMGIVPFGTKITTIGGISNGNI